MLRATAACHFWTSELPKWLRPCGVLCISTHKYASRHSGVPFLNIGTSKMGPGSWCFVHFDLQMCFAPQRRAIFEHRNFQNGSYTLNFLTFRLTNMLRATAACHFSPLRGTASSAPAALASLLFEHQVPRFIEKTQRFATSLTFFAHVVLRAGDSTRMLIFLLVTWLMLIFLLLTWLMLIFLLLTWLLCDSAFQLYILSEVRLLNFLRWTKTATMCKNDCPLAFLIENLHQNHGLHGKNCQKVDLWNPTTNHFLSIICHQLHLARQDANYWIIV